MQAIKISIYIFLFSFFASLKLVHARVEASENKLSINTISLSAERASGVSSLQLPWSPPTSKDKKVTINEDTSYKFSLSDFPIEGWFRDLQRLEITTLPERGTLTLKGKPVKIKDELKRNDIDNLLYQPATGEFGENYASFTFRVSNGVSYSEKAYTFSFDVMEVNDPPTLNAFSDPAAINEDAGTQTINFSGVSSGSPNENQTLTVTAKSSNTAVLPDPTVNYSSPATTGTLVYKPVPDAFGTVVVTVTVNDGGNNNNTISRQFTVRINPINDPPTLDVIADPAPILENAEAKTLTLHGITTGAPNENQKITVTATSSNKDLLPDPQVNYKTPDATATLTYKPNTNKFGTAEVTVTVTDDGDGNNSISRKFKVVVNPLNRPPTLDAIADPAAIDEDAVSQTLQLKGITSGASSENQTLKVTATSNNKDLIPDPTVSYSSPATTGTLSFQPNENRFGSAIISVTVDDGAPNNNTTTRIFTVKVNPINDAPRMDNVEDTSPLKPNAGAQTVNLTGIQAGPFENQAISITATSDNPALVPNPVIKYTSPAATGQLVFTPVPDQTGEANITIKVQDDGQAEAPHQNTATYTFKVTVIDMPDLVVDNPTLSRNTFSVGQVVEAFSRVRNAGKKPAGASVLKYYLSKDKLFQPTDIELAASNTTALAVGAGVSLNTNFSLPEGTTSGTYYILFVADATDEIDEGSEMNNMSFVQVNVQVNDPAVIASIDFPGYYTYGASDEFIAVKLPGDAAVTKVKFFHKGIRAATWEVIDYQLTGLDVKIPLSEGLVDEIGVQYYFEIYTVRGLRATTGTGFTYILHAGEGLPFPDLIFGKTEEDYQIIATPLQLRNNTVPAVFEDDLRPYHPALWRLFHYVSDTINEYNQGFTTLEVGKGYWLIVRKEANIDTGEGNTVQVQQTNPFVINLQPGWNQIGNPYNFNISWEQVLFANNLSPDIGDLMVYDKGFQESDVLGKMKGGFVYAEKAITIKMPLYAAEEPPSVGRIGSGNRERNIAAGDGWEISLILKSGGRVNKLSGFGMHVDASLHKDVYDAVALPDFDFLGQSQIKFDHPEHQNGSFRKDIVPLQQDFIWDFYIDNPRNATGSVLEWDAATRGSIDGELFLYDIQKEKIIDMNQVNSYVVPAQSSRFQIYFGSSAFIDENLKPQKITVGAVYPNPFNDNVSISYTLADSEDEYQVHFMVYNTFGQLVHQNARKDSAGFHTLLWTAVDKGGNTLAPGIYIYKMIIQGNAETRRVEVSGKLIKQ